MTLALGGLVIVLVVAFFALGTGDGVDVAFNKGFVAYWNSGTGVDAVVDQWFRYHVVKAVIAALLLVVLGILFRKVSGAAVVPVTLLGLLSLAALMANIQGMVAPLSSLLPMLEGPTADQVRRRLAAGDHTPVLDVLVDDFARYHWAMAVIAGVVAVVFGGLSVVSWRRRARGFGVLTTLLSVALVVVVVANTIAATHSPSALLALFEGSW